MFCYRRIGLSLRWRDDVKSMTKECHISLLCIQNVLTAYSKSDLSLRITYLEVLVIDKDSKLNIVVV